MGVFNFIAFLGALVLAAAGGGGVWWLDRHADVNLTFPVAHEGFPWVGLEHVHWVGPAIERDRALADAVALRARLAAVDVAAQQKRAAAEPIVREAKAAQARAVVIRDRIMAAPPQDDPCRFARAVDEIFMETLTR